MTENTGKVAAAVIPRTAEENEYLIARRSDNGKWEFPGGKQHKNESIDETAEREIKEELSLEVTAEKSKPSFSWKGGGYQIIPVYMKHGYEDLQEEIEQEQMPDHDDFRFLSCANADHMKDELGEEIYALRAFNII